MIVAGSEDSDRHRLRAMTDADATKGALDDPDNQPFAVLREREQGLSQPDAPAEALLRLVAHEPEMAARILGTAPRAA